MTAVDRTFTRAERQRIADLRRGKHPAPDLGTGGAWRVELKGLTTPLSMNDRGLRWQRARDVAATRALTWTAAITARLPRCERAHVALHYAPRDRRTRDPINLSATLKPVQDGLVDAAVVLDDDPVHMVSPMPVIHASTGQPGRLWVLVRPLPRITGLPDHDAEDDDVLTALARRWS